MANHQITQNAYAKVNLTLEALGRRDDGYHDVVSVIQTVDLHDTLTFEPAEQLELVCDDPELAGCGNLAWRAARLLRDAAGTADGARISIVKRIPVAAGLGGGSSDAAATLVALNRLWRLGLSTEELTPLAARLGSDVPFLLRGGTAMVSGRGERVAPLPPADLEWLVIACPDIPVPNKTASLYGRLSPVNFTRGALTRRLAARIRGGGDLPPQFLFNVFDDVAFDAFPGLRNCWNAMHAMGAREVHLAGSGPSLFAPVSSREVGAALQLLLTHRHGVGAHLVKTRSSYGEGGECTS